MSAGFNMKKRKKARYQYRLKQGGARALKSALGYVLSRQIWASKGVEKTIKDDNLLILGRTNGPPWASRDGKLTGKKKKTLKKFLIHSDERKPEPHCVRWRETAPTWDGVQY